MSNDIVERLRLGWPNTLEITDEAADEIERLRVENWQLKGALGYPVPGHIMDNSDFKCGLCEAKTDEVERLRAERDDLFEANGELANGLAAENLRLRAEVAALRANAPFDAVEDYKQFRRDHPDTVTVDE